MKLITVKLQGKEVQADLLNPEVVKRVEAGLNEVSKKFVASSTDKNIPGSEGIRQQCQAVIDYITDIFGAEAGKKVFGTETDLLTCLDVVEEMVDLYPTQVTPLIRKKREDLEGKLDKRRSSEAGGA